MVKVMANPLEPVLAIQVVSECDFVRSSIGSVDQGLNWYLGLIGELDKFPHSLIVKCSNNVSDLEIKLRKGIKDKQQLELTQNEW